MANGFKGLTQKEVREKLIRDRAARKKQKEKLAKRKAEASEFTDYMSRSNSPLVKLAKERLDGRAGAKVTKGRLNLLTPKAAKADTKTTKQVDTKAAQAKRKASDAMSSKKKTPSAPTSRPKAPTKNFNVGVSKGGVTFKEAFKHFRKKGQSTFTWNGTKYTTNLEKAKPKASIKTPTPADFTATGPKKPEQKAKPKTKKKPSNAPNVGLGKMKTFGGLPVGALRKLGSKGYNSKKERLKKVGNTTYVFKKGK